MWKRVKELARDEGFILVFPFAVFGLMCFISSWILIPTFFWGIVMMVNIGSNDKED